MFMFPEPPPLDYYITDIAPIFLSDGVFHHGNPAPTHKYIGKQLSPIKRTLSDPLAPIQQLDPRTLERWLEQEDTGYVEPSGKDDGMVFETLRWMPETKHHHGTRQKQTMIRILATGHSQKSLWRGISRLFNKFYHSRLVDAVDQIQAMIKFCQQEYALKPLSPRGRVSLVLPNVRRTFFWRLIVAWYINCSLFKVMEGTASTISINQIWTTRAIRAPPSIFPRSPQYELWYIRDRRARGFAIPETVTVECSRREETPKKNDEPCGLLKPPFWWEDEAGRRKSLPVGDINDYAFEKLKESEADERKISERLELDHPRKYIPGAIHRLKNPEDTSMKDTLDRADAFKVVLRSDYTLPEDDGGKKPVTKTPCPAQIRPCMRVHRDAKQHQDARDDDKTRFDSDSRWQPFCNEIGFSGTDLERQKELRKLTRPFLHDLHTWYSKNKPTKSSVTR